MMLIPYKIKHELRKELKIEKLCKNCRFWERIRNEYGQCANELVDEQISDGEGMLPVFPSTFGCIHFEVKE